MNDSDKLNMERSTELLFAKRKVQELTNEKEEYEKELEMCSNAYNEYKDLAGREIKALKERVKELMEQNATYLAAIKDMKIFFHKVNNF